MEDEEEGAEESDGVGEDGRGHGGGVRGGRGGGGGGGRARGGGGGSGCEVRELGIGGAAGVHRAHEGGPVEGAVAVRGEQAAVDVHQAAQAAGCAEEQPDQLRRAAAGDIREGVGGAVRDVQAPAGALSGSELGGGKEEQGCAERGRRGGGGGCVGDGGERGEGGRGRCEGEAKGAEGVGREVREAEQQRVRGDHAEEHQPDIPAESTASGPAGRPGVRQQGGGYVRADSGPGDIDEDGDDVQAGAGDG